MHYSILIQGSSDNDTLKWFYPYKYCNPTITSITVLFWPNHVNNNKVYTTNVISNSNDDDVPIPPGYYTIAEIIAILNSVINTRFSTSTKASSYGCICFLIPTFHWFHLCSRYSRNPRFGKTNRHSTRFVLWIERDWYHAKSSSDPSVLVSRAFLRSEDCQPEQQPAHHNDHWRSRG